MRQRSCSNAVFTLDCKLMWHFHYPLMIGMLCDFRWRWWVTRSYSKRPWHLQVSAMSAESAELWRWKRNGIRHWDGRCIWWYCIAWIVVFTSRFLLLTTSWINDSVKLVLSDRCGGIVVLCEIAAGCKKMFYGKLQPLSTFSRRLPTETEITLKSKCCSHRPCMLHNGRILNKKIFMTDELSFQTVGYFW